MDTENIMFDFQGYYDKIAYQIPSGSRLAEIGVADGNSAIYLAKKLLQHNKEFKLYMVDNMDYGGYLQMKKIYENVIEAGVGKYVEVVPFPSIEASGLFNDGYLDFVFIDASHEYEQTKNDIKAWYPKIRDLGILAGHDYFHCEGVKKAVDELIPLKTQRTDIPNRTFPVEHFLHIEDTSRGYGLWHCQKDFYKHLSI